ncbi:hypothetical protein [Nitrosopumilus sp.]|uniref:hypothetical protein n=1 Tax=Nitrosopumilus sp. TaxID=2024843 RepID=UPI00247B3F1C|nr:hypothetical protein [Nitrosopumilus sp.]MCV0409292.1 hypothetical protein [Nitrosopumilus sp.]
MKSSATNRIYDLQRYSCKVCRKRFSFNLGYEKMRVSPQVVTSALQLYRGVPQKRSEVHKASVWMLLTLLSASG